MNRTSLFLAHRIPFPPDRGDKIRSWQLIRALAALGRVHLVAFADDEADAAHLPDLRAALGGALGQAHIFPRRRGAAAAGLRAIAAGKPVSLTMFDDARLRATVRKILREEPIETLFAFSGQMAQFIPAGGPPRVVLDLGDVDSAKFQEYAQARHGPMAWVYRREARRLADFERASALRADMVTFVSEAEAALFRRRTGLVNVEALGNGIDLEFFRRDADFPRLDLAVRGPAPILLFTGQMDYPPNVDAVRWFVREVLPSIPAARFVIAGRNPVEKVRALVGPRVTVTGAVGDMRSWLAAADLVVAPLRIARGIQNKVLEAMAMAKPVVATPAAFEGIEAEPGRDLIVAASADEQASAINRLLANPEEARGLGARARDLVERSYAWERRLRPLTDLAFPSCRDAA
jgi:sugar transferase (PEP-CTERM/EpsH1 system associated)